jgi:hypothetical protein
MPNHGARSHNLAIKEAKTDFICYLGDDNIIMPNHLQLIYDGLSSGEYDVVYTKTHEIRIGVGNNMVEKIMTRNLYKDLEPEAYVKNDLTYKDPRDISQLGHTKQIFEKAGPWKLSPECPNNVEDSWYMDHLDKIAGNKILNIPIYSCVYYARKACHYRDDAYHSAVNSLNESQTYVYPELLKETGVL